VRVDLVQQSGPSPLWNGARRASSEFARSSGRRFANTNECPPRSQVRPVAPVLPKLLTTNLAAVDPHGSSTNIIGERGQGLNPGSRTFLPYIGSVSEESDESRRNASSDATPPSAGAESERAPLLTSLCCRSCYSWSRLPHGRPADGTLRTGLPLLRLGTSVDRDHPACHGLSTGLPIVHRVAKSWSAGAPYP